VIGCNFNTSLHLLLKKWHKQTIINMKNVTRYRDARMVKSRESRYIIRTVAYRSSVYNFPCTLFFIIPVDSSMEKVISKSLNIRLEELNKNSDQWTLTWIPSCTTGQRIELTWYKYMEGGFSLEQVLQQSLTSYYGHNKRTNMVTILTLAWQFFIRDSHQNILTDMVHLQHHLNRKTMHSLIFSFLTHKI